MICRFRHCVRDVAIDSVLINVMSASLGRWLRNPRLRYRPGWIERASVGAQRGLAQVDRARFVRVQGLTFDILC